MSAGKQHQTSEANELERVRQASGVSQRALARDLGITQGHYSKVVDGLVGDKKGYVARGLRLLSNPSDPSELSEGIDRIVQATVRELRSSAAFRRLIDAALGYSWRDET
jgi:predicted transcriptional regulator